ncbi:hypothetical protein [Pricia sp.]|uniref:hypothetical protein n=1 Tax=Pricia sp. TaxID=2268138 RepID=UPI0035947FBC
MKQINLFSVLTIAVLFFFGCEKEVENLPVALTFTEKLEAQFNKNEFSEYIPYDFEVDWSAYTESFSEELGSKFYEFDIRYTSDFNPTALGIDTQNKYALLVLEGENSEKKFVVANLAGSTNDFNSLHFSRMADFTGTVRFNSGNLEIPSLLIAEGLIVGNLTTIDGENLEELLLAGKAACGCEEDDGSGKEDGGGYIVVTTVRTTDWYLVKPDGKLVPNGSTSTTTRETVFQVKSPSAYSNLQRSSGYRRSGSGSPGGQTGTVNFEEKTIKKIDERQAWNSLSILEELAPDTPITDLKEFLKCYDITKPATITLYANQPSSGSSASFDPTSTDPVGHAFISISQNGKTSTFGFYPESEAKKGAINGPSIMGNNGGDDFDVSMTMSVSGPTLKKIIAEAVSFPTKYEIYSYNCTDYALELANLAGANIPNAWGPYPGGGGGDNPGKLGQIIRSKNNGNGITINKTGGKAPGKTGGCN